MMRAAALSVGGLDPCSGAGLGADLRAFELAGVWGCAVCAALTEQSTQGVRAVHPVRTAIVAAQIQVLLADVAVRAIKTGALGSPSNVRYLAHALAPTLTGAPLIVDPVLLPTATLGPAQPAAGRAPSLSGARSLAALRDLAAVATLLTPNIPEAQALLGTTLRSAAHARDAAMALLDLGPAAVLLKGGHFGADVPGQRGSVVDWLATSDGVEPLRHRWIDTGGDVHGTGCMLASLIAGRLAACAGPVLDRAAHPARPSKSARSSRGPSAGCSRSQVRAACVWAVGRLGRMLRSPVHIGHGLAVLGGRAATARVRGRAP